MADPASIAAAIRAHQPLPAIGANLDLAAAYALQAEVAPLVSPEGFAGIKAGVTNPALQKNFGIDHALLGRLYENGRLTNGATLPNIEGRLLECEIGLIVDDSGAPVSKRQLEVQRRAHWDYDADISRLRDRGDRDKSTAIGRSAWLFACDLSQGHRGDAARSSLERRRRRGAGRRRSAAF